MLSLDELSSLFSCSSSDELGSGGGGRCCETEVELEELLASVLDGLSLGGLLSLSVDELALLVVVISVGFG